MRRLELVLHPPRAEGRAVSVASSLSGAGLRRDRLWFRVPEEHAGGLAEGAEPHLAGWLFPLMQLGRPVLVRGRVSPSLLRGIGAFMDAWAGGRHGLYRKVDIAAELGREPPAPGQPGRAVMTFSGGVDSCYTAWRHRKGLAGSGALDLRTAAFVHGFDVPLRETAGFEAAYRRNLALVTSIGMELVPVATNFRELEASWWDAHGSALAAALWLFHRRHDTGVVAASAPAGFTGGRGAPHATTNPLLSGCRFRVAEDGPVRRLEKVGAVADWPEALLHLHVCWEDESGRANCCRCEKCIRTILEFRALGKGLPPCFPRDVSDRQIRNTRLHSRGPLTTFQAAADAARRRGEGDAGWVAAVDTAVRRYRRRAWLEAADEAIRYSAWGRRLSRWRRRLGDSWRTAACEGAA